MKKNHLLLGTAICLVVSLMLPFSAGAIGMVTKPISIPDALRGGSYQDSVIIVNSENTAVNIMVTTDGDIATWAKFFLPDQSTEAADTVEIPANGRLNMIVRFNVPSSTPNGLYAGLISVTKISTAASSTEGSTSAMNQKIDRIVSIEVDDQEIVSFEASVIPKDYDLVTGNPLAIRFIYDNRGNVGISPQIQLKILRNDNTVYNVIHPYPENLGPILPGEIKEIATYEVPTTNLAAGIYSAEAKFLIDGNTRLTKNFNFKIVEQGQSIYPWLLSFGLQNIIALLILVAICAILIFFSGAAKKIKPRKKMIGRRINNYARRSDRIIVMSKNNLKRKKSPLVDLDPKQV